MLKYLLPSILFFICVLLIILLHFLIPIRILIEGNNKQYGIVIIILGRYISYRGAKVLKTKKKIEVCFPKSCFLVTDDIYQYTRSPMYLGYTLMLMGFSAVLGSLSPFFVVVGFIVILNLGYIPPLTAVE